MKVDISPSFLGHKTKCQWFGIKQYAKIRIGVRAHA